MNFLIALLLLLCAWPSTMFASIKSVEVVKNSAVKWSIGPSGNLYATSSGFDGHFCDDLKIDPTVLLPLLDDPDRFVAAHVLLSLVNWKHWKFHDSSSPDYFGITPHNWGPLEVHINVNGSVFIDPAQAKKISNFWHEKLNAPER
jgi:hypothetical protein